jgi:pre-mRNA-splicing helicase BRR2
MGDIPPEVLTGAASDILETLKDDTKKDFDRKREVEDVMMTKLSSEIFAKLVNLGKRITDFRPEDAAGVTLDDGSTVAQREQGLDEEYGVAVVFDDDNEDEEGSEDEYEVKEDVDEDDENESPETMEDEGITALQKVDGEVEDEEQIDDDGDLTTVITPPTLPTAGKRKDTSATAIVAINPHEVDAFWLQRQVASVYNDAHTVQLKTQSALEVMASSRNARDLENELMGLFDYDKFDLVKLLTRNRDTIVWCTKLAKAATPDDRHAIEEEMRDNELDHILKQLSLAPTRKVEERSRRGVVEGAMELDMASRNQAAAVAAKVEATPIGRVPLNSIDLESLVFEQGSHLMSNKKCKLPEGSFKRSKKGYEEVHVPPPKQKPPGPNEKLVDITSLPAWAQPAFKNAKSLNRIQSKVYPVAFKDDVNMLLCAPTGAGKVIVPPYLFL